MNNKVLYLTLTLIALTYRPATTNTDKTSASYSTGTSPDASGASSAVQTTPNNNASSTIGPTGANATAVHTTVIDLNTNQTQTGVDNSTITPTEKDPPIDDTSPSVTTTTNTRNTGSASTTKQKQRKEGVIVFNGTTHRPTSENDGVCQPVKVTDMKFLKKQLSKIRNVIQEYRRKYHVQQLEEVGSLQEDAQKMAEMAAGCDNTVGFFTEAKGGKGQIRMRGQDYKEQIEAEKLGFVYGLPDKFIVPVSQRFSQIVWKNTQKMGIGAAVARNGQVITVVNFVPAGNVQGEYRENVLTADGTEVNENIGALTAIIAHNVKQTLTDATISEGLYESAAEATATHAVDILEEFLRDDVHLEAHLAGAQASLAPQLEHFVRRYVSAVRKRKGKEPLPEQESETLTKVKDYGSYGYPELYQTPATPIHAIHLIIKYGESLEKHYAKMKAAGTRRRRFTKLKGKSAAHVGLPFIRRRRSTGGNCPSDECCTKMNLFDECNSDCPKKCPWLLLIILTAISILSAVLLIVIAIYCTVIVPQSTVIPESKASRASRRSRAMDEDYEGSAKRASEA